MRFTTIDSERKRNMQATIKTGFCPLIGAKKAPLHLEKGSRVMTSNRVLCSLFLALFGFTSQGAAQIEFLCESDCVVGTVGCGETVSGSIGPGDCYFRGHVDVWSLEITATSTVTVNLRTTDFAPRLVLVSATNCNYGSEIAFASESFVRRLNPGSYRIFATRNPDAGGGDTGAYELEVSCASQCDTHCRELTIERVDLPEANVRITVDAIDDSDDAIQYSVFAQRGLSTAGGLFRPDGHQLRAGPQGTNVFELSLEPGEWRISTTVEDGLSCRPNAPDFRCRGTITMPDLPTFLRGDCNDDGAVDISDAVCTLNWLFAGVGVPGCVAATNANGDDDANISDATYLLNHLFSGGPAPVAPFPDCGPGMLPADEALGCANPPDC